jgi:hypothetical protein
LPSKVIEQVLNKKKDWELEHKKDITEWIFNNIISYFLTK